MDSQERTFPAMDVLADHEDSPQPGPADQDNLQTDSPGHFDLPDQSIPIFDDINNYSTREPRPQRQRRGVQPTTWLDNDDTGNYDPAQERTVKKPRIRLSTRPRPLINHEKERIPIENPKVNVSLTFTSEKGKQDFSDLISRLHAQDATEEAGYKLRSRVQDEEEDTISGDIDLSAKPFARGCLECATLSGSGVSHCSLLHDERHWPCATCEEDGNECQLIVAPVRKRACETCKRRRIACSYKYTRNHGVTCSQCASSGVTCVAGPDAQYIKARIRYDRDREIDPLSTKKGKLPANEQCYECSQSGTPCHFSSEVDGSPCEACKVSGSPCTIGQGPPPPSTPPSRHKKRKRELEKETKTADESQEKPKADKIENANRAKETIVERKRQGTVEAKEPSYTPQFPKTFKMPNTCNPHSSSIVKKQPQATPPVPSERTPQPQHRFPTYQTPPQRPKPSSRAVFRKIHTSFCHPMQFNCDTDEEDETNPKNPCHFCSEPTLPFWGLGRVHVEVIDWQDYSPYTEVSKGHKAKGYDPTRLCTNCTTDRLEVMLCNRHEMVPIPGAQYTDDQMNEAMDDLLDGHMRHVEEYCALCGHLAQYECQAARGDDGEGCGLRLCDGCAYTLELKHGCDLQHMLANSFHGPSDTAPLGIRADAELLNAKRGPLARFLRSISNEQQ